MKKTIFTLLYLLIAGSSMAQATLLNPRTDSKLLKDFQNRKLGLFVHWMACHTPETGDSWSIGRGTTRQVADSITLAWDPEKFDAKEIVDFAVKAGCGYIVVISKHHDGFSIWDSKYTDFDMQRIPLKKDILKDLGEECRKQGLLFGIYYSIADLHYTGWDKMPEANKPPPAPKGGKDAFVTFSRNQIKELMTRYNPDILWFDGYWLDSLWSKKEGASLYSFIKAIKPNVLSTRLSVTKDAAGHETFLTDGSSGDFFSFEAKTKDAPVFPWEACTSITYPVYAYEPKAPMLSKDTLITMFDRVICGNGNLLLNIGPKRDGALPGEQTQRFLEFSDWVKQHAPAVYNTAGGPFKQGAWGGSTFKGNKIYIHVREPLSEMKINTLKGYRILSVRDIASGKPVALSKEGNGYLLQMNKQENAPVSVIELVLDKPYQFTGWLDREKI